MDNVDNLFNPSLATALKKLDPDDGEQIMEYFKIQALLSREKALVQTSVRDQKKLLVENSKLKKDIEQLRGQLQDKQKRRTAKALLSPAPPPHSTSPAPTTLNPASGSTAAAPINLPAASGAGRRRRVERKARPKSQPLSLGAEPQIDAARLDLRVGRIVGIQRHPLVEAMCVQEVDVGGSCARKVVSKLTAVKDPDELRGSLGVFLCNIKASKIRGVVSQGRLLCCSASDGSIELLIPPAGSAPGDRITFLNFPGEPEGELPSRQRIWERLQPDLKVDGRGVANYRGCAFEVKGKGLCRAPSLTNCTIR